MCRIKQLRVTHDAKVHTTWFKQRLLAQFSFKRAQKKGRDALIAFEGTPVLLWPNPVILITTMMQSILHAQHRLFVDICLKIQTPLLGCQLDVNKTQCHSYCLLSSIWYLKGPASRIKVKTKLLLLFPLKLNSMKHKHTRCTTKSLIVRHSTT